MRFGALSSLSFGFSTLVSTFVGAFVEESHGEYGLSWAIPCTLWGIFVSMLVGVFVSKFLLLPALYLPQTKPICKNLTSGLWIWDFSKAVVSDCLIFGGERLFRSLRKSLHVVFRQTLQHCHPWILDFRHVLFYSINSGLTSSSQKERGACSYVACELVSTLPPFFWIRPLFLWKTDRSPTNRIGGPRGVYKAVCRRDVNRPLFWYDEVGPLLTQNPTFLTLSLSLYIYI